MRKTHSTAAVAAALLTCFASGLVPVWAQDSKDRVVEQFTCKDIMRESGANRDVVIAFLHGFLLGKSGSSKFNLDVLRRESDDLIERCLDNPGEKAVDAAAKVKG
jgi:HdeA/HdeB family protein